MIIIHIIYNLAVLVSVSVMSGFIDKRWSRATLHGKILQGLIFGSTAIIAMLNPFELAPGIIFDGRSVVPQPLRIFLWTGNRINRRNIGCNC